MYYNEISGVKVSALGMGNMRLPKIEGERKSTGKRRRKSSIMP